jgi:hypothetical protein
MIKIAHEAPLCLMPRIRELTDYCYALVHLFEENSAYFEYFVESKKLGRTVLLDNSIFELGVAFDAKKYSDWIQKLEPDEYIIPDALEDTKTTIENYKNWIRDYKNLPGKKIGVVQGKTYSELYDCYQFMADHSDKIAISFDYSYYLTTARGHNKYQQYCEGRYKLINNLLEDNIINHSKPHHLLGWSVPAEFGYYGSRPAYYKFIESLDTSNPVINGMHNIKYDSFGVKDKLNAKMVDFFNVKSIKKEGIALIEHNIEKFKIITNTPKLIA